MDLDGILPPLKCDITIFNCITLEVYRPASEIKALEGKRWTGFYSPRFVSDIVVMFPFLKGTSSFYLPRTYLPRSHNYLNLVAKI